MKTCKTCGSAIQDDTTLCPVCGEKQEDENRDTPEAAPVVPDNTITKTTDPEVRIPNPQWQDPADTVTFQPPAKHRRKGLIIFLCILAGIAVIGVIVHFAFGRDDNNGYDHNYNYNYNSSGNHGSYDDSDGDDIHNSTIPYQIYGLDIQIPASWDDSATQNAMDDWGYAAGDILGFYSSKSDYADMVYYLSYEGEIPSYVDEEIIKHLYNIPMVIVDIPIEGCNNYVCAYGVDDEMEYYGALVEVDGSVFQIVVIAVEGEKDIDDIRELFNMPDFETYYSYYN